MPDFHVAPPEQNTLLTVASLRLSEDILVRTIRPGRIAIKYQPAATHLVVDPEQWKVLERFRTADTAPRVLCDLINERLCPPLREYYELLVKALRAGVLQTAGHPAPPPVPASEWRARLAGRLGRFFALLCMGVSTLLVLLNLPPLPSQPHHLFLGWLAICVAQSAGAFLAACVLRGGDLEVYSPRFLFRTPFPRFSVSLRDAVMLGRDGEIDTALARVAPFFLFAALASLLTPPLTLPLLGGLLYHLSPFHRGAVVDLLVALHRDPRLDTTRDFLFVPNQAVGILIRNRVRFADRAFLLKMAAYSQLWLLLVFLAACSLLRVNVLELLHRFKASGGARITAFVVLAGLGLAVLGGAVLGVWMLAHQVRAALDPWLRRREARRSQVDVSAETISACLGRTHLFRHLPPEELAQLVAVAKPRELPKHAIVLRQGDPGDALFVILSGTVEVLREQTVGRPELIAELAPDDIFGEIALLGDGVRTRTVRAASPLRVLEISRADFKGVVLPRFSREQIETAIQKLAFLARVPLSRNWSPAAMASFARRSQFLEFTPGRRLITEGESNQFFHLIHEGELAVMVGRRRVARLGAGDFFGEISLLQNSVASASIDALTPGRCLVLPRKDFLEFISRDFLVGLHFEEIGSRRLGRPLFPLGRACFAENT